MRIEKRRRMEEEEEEEEEEEKINGEMQHTCTSTIQVQIVMTPMVHQELLV